MTNTHRVTTAVSGRDIDSQTEREAIFPVTRSTNLRQKQAVADGPEVPPALPALSLLSSGPLTCQAVDTLTSLRTPLRVIVVQTAVHFTDDLTNRLQTYGITSLLIASPEAVLQQLNTYSNDWDIVLYPIVAQWQRALDFAREVRRTRERQGGHPRPRVLVLSFVEHLPTTIEWFRRASGTRYLQFNSVDGLVHALWSIRDEISESNRALRLHLRLVHAGNRFGTGCIAGERLVGIYGSFYPGCEREIVEAQSVLNFLNLLAMNHWRFRSKTEILRLMAGSPFYSGDGAKVISASSIKTYIARSESSLRVLCQESGDTEEPPTLIARAARGSKEVAYRFLCSSEIDHI
jgi:hypothetical protein